MAASSSRPGEAGRHRRCGGQPVLSGSGRLAARIVRACGRLPRATAGVSAVEFALVLPVLVVIFMGVVEINRLIWVTKKCVAAANAIGEMLSSAQTAPTASDLKFISDAAMIINPQVLFDAQAQGTAWTSIMQATFTSVVFKPTVPGCLVLCTYTANVAWSAGLQRRACGTLQSVPDSAAYSATSLPQSLFQQSSALVVDIRYVYQPIFGSRIAGTRTIARSAYFVPRYLDPLTLGDLSANPSIATKCPGY